MSPARITNRSRRYKIPDGLLLQETRLLDHFMEDISFVSLDFEGEDNFFAEPGIIRPVSLGISILDTRDFKTRQPDIISTQNLCFMSPRQFKETDRHFMFGTSEELPFITTKDALREKITCVLSQEDPEKRDMLRKIVLVTFDARGEAVIMEHLGIRLVDQPSLVGILDVQHEMMRIMGVPHGKRSDQLWSFMKALEACKVSFGNLHVGGNDAYFNLQLLLSLVSIESKGKGTSLTEVEQHKLSAIQDVSSDVLQIDRTITPACFEYNREIGWKSAGFRKRAYKYIRNSLPEVQEARRQTHAMNVEKRKDAKRDFETWHKQSQGIEGFPECFDGFRSE